MNRSFRSLAVSFAAVALGLSACGPADKAMAGPVDDAALRNVETHPDEWLTHGRDYAETRFSPLTQIDENNVSQLGLVYSYATGTDRGLEATPLVHDGIIYTTLPWSVVQAIDARSGKLIWEWDPGVDRARGQLACCDVVNRGVALFEGKVYVGTLDGRLVALDAATGSPLWDVITVDQSKSYTITGAPRVVAGKVIIGNGGAEYGVRGYVSAYDANTGEMVWRFYTVPGDPSQPFESRALAAAVDTWTGEWWKYGGGGTVWDAIAFDPELGLLYIGTGNGSPWNREIRSPGGGDNLFLSSIVALEVETGEMRWYYQTTPGDSWDFTATQHIMLADLPIRGETRQVLMQAPKNGYFYVLDRATGELLSATAYTTMNWSVGIEPESGRPIEAPNARYLEQREVVQPGAYGGHNWHPMSFNPATGLVYIPMQEASMVYAQPANAFSYREGAWNTGTNMGAGAGVQRAAPTGYLLAWDPVRGEARWSVPYGDIYNGGTLSTAGNLVFQGTSDGRMVAYRATDGKLLWEAYVGGGVMAAPITYELDGVQYLTVMAGWGGSYGLSGRGRVATPGRMLVFAIGGSAVLESETVKREAPAVIASNASPATIQAGATLFTQSCAVCHGQNAESSGVIPDLRYATPETIARIQNIVLGGERSSLGMPSFANALTEEQLASIRAYLLSRRAELYP
ncbi:MAG: PQQ-dependent dehydrogenase, methanol/ethanol family [Gemmatimonadota bacterium]|jgi:quinohemoprotein ethanol dehydrogenase|nr:PQQ-dependent dehydrogenase, methanol/ethanol family [Gemmatimonadota bacterium]